MLIPQRAFSSGELSPSLYARVDYFRYATGAKIIKNCYVKKSGGVENRGGTIHIADVDYEQSYRLMPFIFSQDQTYIIALTDNGRSPVVKSEDYVYTGSQTISSANESFAVYVGADNFQVNQLITFDSVVCSDSNLIDFLENSIFKISTVNTGTNTVTFTRADGQSTASLSFSAFATAGNMKRVYTITTPYLSGQLTDVKYAQSKGVMTLVHPLWEPRELTRVADDNWTLSTISTVPSQTAPTSPSATQNGTTASAVYNYKLAAINDNTKEESLPTAAFGVTNGNATLDTTNYVGISATAASGATEYAVYKELNQSGTYGFIGFLTGGSTFRDIGYTPDTTDRPIDTRTPFSGSNNYPSCVVYYQQRRGFANTNNDTEIVEFSRTAFPNNFTVSKPSQSNDAVSFSASGTRANPVNHMIDLGNLVLFTDSGEKIVQGDNAGVLSPTSINLKQFSYNGSANNPAPIVIDNTALYVQYGGSIIRDFFADIAVDGYKGNDLTIFSNHLFDGYTIVDWAYQKTPNSILWAVRNDGKVLSLTYIKDQQMLAWSQHDFGGIAESVCSVPNGSVYDVYIVVKRLLPKNSLGRMEYRKTIEKIDNREIVLSEQYTARVDSGDGSNYLDKFFYRSNYKEKVFSDSSVLFDFRNTTSARLYASLVSSDVYDIIDSTASGPFASTDVGSEIRITSPSDGSLNIFEILSYTNSSTLRCRSVKTPSSDILTSGEATSDWAFARKSFGGLFHLEGQEVSVRGDGYVVASPNNPDYNSITVSNDRITTQKCYSVVSIGLPYTSDIQTLAIDGTQNTTVGKQQMIKKVYVHTEKTQTMWVGTRNPDNVKLNSTDDPLYGLYEVKNRNEENYDEVAGFLKERFEVKVEGTYEEQAEVFIRNVDPTSMTVLAITPEGVLNFS